MKEIGGFFNLEINDGQEYHKNALKLNSARYCIEYILKLKKYKRIYIPKYICNSVLQENIYEGVDVILYDLDYSLMPKVNRKMNSYEVLLFINYFGLNSDKINYVYQNYKNVIVDNTQSFYELPYDGVDTIYSPRKFFGVPDGGYLYKNNTKEIKINRSYSYDNCQFLLKRIDVSANESYSLFKANEQRIATDGMKKMSKLTEKILKGIDYDYCKKKREENFQYLHSKLSRINELDIKCKTVNGPMIYPLLIQNQSLREYLIYNKIYVAKYWEDSLVRLNKNSYEAYFCNNLIPLPIDQRYGIKDMKNIISIIGKKCDLLKR